MPRAYNYVGNVDRFKNEDFPLDAITQSVISRVKSLECSTFFSLASFQTQARQIFEQGMALIVEYYLQIDMGEFVDFIIPQPKPWSTASLAQILRHSSRSFTEHGLTVDVQQLGNTLARLTAPQHGLESGSVTTVKILGLMLTALSMIPEEPPRLMRNTPKLNFEKAMKIYKEKHKEMRTLWESCVEFVNLQNEASEALTPWLQQSFPERTYAPQSETNQPAQALPVPHIDNNRTKLASANQGLSLGRQSTERSHSSLPVFSMPQPAAYTFGQFSAYIPERPPAPVKFLTRRDGGVSRTENTSQLQNSTDLRPPANNHQEQKAERSPPLTTDAVPEHRNQSAVQSNPYVPVHAAVRPATYSSVEARDHVSEQLPIQHQSATLPPGYGRAQGSRSRYVEDRRPIQQCCLSDNRPAAVVQDPPPLPNPEPPASTDAFFSAQFMKMRASGAVPFGPEGILNLPDGGAIGYFPQFCPNADALFPLLMEEVPWQRKHVYVGDVKVDAPRLVCYMADAPSLSFTYSGVTMQPLPYTPFVSQIKSELEKALDVSFNSVLLNLYQDGREHLPWHSHNHPLFGKEPRIAFVSFGAPRAFDVRNNRDPVIHFRYMLGNGDVLTMEGGAVQRHWKHTIVQNMKLKDAQISLTFRIIEHPELDPKQ